MSEELFIVRASLKVEYDLSLVSELFGLTHFKTLEEVNVLLEVLHMLGSDVVWEVLSDLVHQKVRKSQLNLLVFGTDHILLDDSDDFLEGGQVDNVLGLFIKVLQELQKTLRNAFALPGDEAFQILVDRGTGSIELVDSETQLVDGHRLLLFHFIMVMVCYIICNQFGVNSHINLSPSN